MDMKSRKLMDVRSRDKYLNEGLITKADIENYVNNLEDCSANAEWMLVDMEDAEVGGEVSSLSDKDSAASTGEDLA